MSDVTLDALKDGLDALSSKTTTLYIPKPLVMTGGDKWRIQRKNVVDLLEERAPHATQTRELVENLELEDFRGEGLVVFEDAGGDTNGDGGGDGGGDGAGFRTSHMNGRPQAMLCLDDKPFALPLLRDVGSRHTAWVLALDKDEPELFLYSGGDVIDHSARLRVEDGSGGDEVPVSMDTVRERREVQNDFFFHSGSRGSVRTAQARSSTHALGADVDREEEKTLDAYYQLVIDAVRFGLPFQVRELFVMGTEKVVGRFCQLAEGDLGADFALHQIHDGEATPERIKTHLESRLSELPERPDVETVTDAAAILEAARMGRVGRLIVSDGLAGLDTTTDEDSERLKTLVVGEGMGEALSDAVPVNAVALACLAQGAEFDFVGHAFARAPLEAVMRWSQPGDPEGVGAEGPTDMADATAGSEA